MFFSNLYQTRSHLSGHAIKEKTSKEKHEPRCQCFEVVGVIPTLLVHSHTLAVCCLWFHKGLKVRRMNPALIPAGYFIYLLQRHSL